jgi:hypothetical protein
MRTVQSSYDFECDVSVKEKVAQGDDLDRNDLEDLPSSNNMIEITALTHMEPRPDSTHSMHKAVGARLQSRF